MEINDYAYQLEKKLVDKFKQDFYKKFDYYPVILTKSNALVEERSKLMSLEELKEYFTPFLPIRNGKTIPLDKKCRIREITELRSIFCYIARTMSYSLKSIGEFLAGKDHTTVIHSIKCFNDLNETSDVFAEKYTMIKNYIKQLNTRENESPAVEHLSEVQD
jgi:hypothetical protein